MSSPGSPTYMQGADPAAGLADYYPAWLEELADEVTVEGSLLDDAVQGAEGVRAILLAIRWLYDRQDYHFVKSSGYGGRVLGTTDTILSRLARASHQVSGAGGTR